MIFLIIASKQAGGRISKDTSTLAAMVNIKIFIWGKKEYINNNR